MFLSHSGLIVLKSRKTALHFKSTLLQSEHVARSTSEMLADMTWLVLMARQLASLNMWPASFSKKLEISFFGKRMNFSFSKYSQQSPAQQLGYALSAPKPYITTLHFPGSMLDRQISLDNPIIFLSLFQAIRKRFWQLLLPPLHKRATAESSGSSSTSSLVLLPDIFLMSSMYCARRQRFCCFQ